MVTQCPASHLFLGSPFSFRFLSFADDLSINIGSLNKMRWMYLVISLILDTDAPAGPKKPLTSSHSCWIFTRNFRKVLCLRYSSLSSVKGGQGELFPFLRILDRNRNIVFGQHHRLTK